MMHYLYYRIYQAALRGSLRDVAHIVSPIYFGCLMGLNLIVFYLWLVKVGIIPYIFPSAKAGGVVVLVCIIGSLFYFTQYRREVIVNRYSSEQIRSRRRRGSLVVLYLIISILLIYFIGLYKPGIL
jgi:uncharacterized membrane protein